MVNIEFQFPDGSVEQKAMNVVPTVGEVINGFGDKFIILKVEHLISGQHDVILVLDGGESSSKAGDLEVGVTRRNR